jgi:hypothetical protein
MDNSSPGYEIENGVPAPLPRKSYPFRGMDVGQSFFVHDASRNAVDTASAQAGRRLERKFSVRAATKNGVAGFRVWRIS